MFYKNKVKLFLQYLSANVINNYKIKNMYIDKTIAFFKCTDQLQSNENNKNTNERKKNSFIFVWRKKGK